MAKLTKERVLNVCKDINKGINPSKAARKEGIPLLKNLVESGIIYKDPITDRWQGRITIHDDRFNQFVKLSSDYKKNHRVRNKAKMADHTHTKVGIFRRIWNSIFG